MPAQLHQGHSALPKATVRRAPCVQFKFSFLSCLYGFGERLTYGHGTQLLYAVKPDSCLNSESVADQERDGTCAQSSASKYQWIVI